MTAISYIILSIIVILSNCLSSWLQSYFTKKGSNAADSEDIEQISYKKGKGNNMATKDDIADITRLIEEVKNEVSFQNQWEKDHILQREQRLIRILYLAEKIDMTYNHILLMASNSQQVSKLLNLVKILNNDALDITHEGNLLIAHYNNQKDIRPATSLIDTAVKYAVELACLANNISVKVIGSEQLKKRALEMNNASSVKTMKDASDLIAEAKQLSEQPRQYKQPLADAINAYIMWLERLYGEGLLIRYNMNVD